MMRAQYKNPKQHEKGAALITVLISVMLITIILFEFQYSSMIERKLAYNDLNQTQAYYLAKSGVNFGLLRLALYGRLAANSQLKAQAKSMGGNIEPFLEQIWQIPLPAFPPTKSSVSQLTKADRDAAEKVLQQTQIVDGQYTHSITSESAKINLNALVVPKQNLDERPNFLVPPKRPDQFTAQMLFNLLERLLRDSDNPYEEYPDLRPDEQVMDIMDWVNPGDNRFFGGSKDSFYTRQDPPYRAKKNKFYTVEELRMVRGITDHLFNKLLPHVTVYSEGSKINLNTASKTTYRALYPDFTDDDATRILRQRDEIGGWTSEAQFVDYVSNELGRSAFKTFYTDPADYPFTVGSESFFIESIGKIDRSASSIQRVIRVAVAMSGGVAGAIVQGVTNANNCNRNQNNFWDRRSNVCRTKPRNESDCQNGWGGTWLKQGQADVCKVNTDASSGGGPMMVPPLQTSGAKVSPNALRILYWAEV
jgi:type II secretory pathway component PulK